MFSALRGDKIPLKIDISPKTPKSNIFSAHKENLPAKDEDERLISCTNSSTKWSAAKLDFSYSTIDASEDLRSKYILLQV